jgi:hypothetical protein
MDAKHGGWLFCQVDPNELGGSHFYKLRNELER